ncbi:MAG: hypothetical protein MRY64_14865 [Hyphomonadaceae bacterium]|nr:hypothetical protein [Hyphomonadaceae bacterium]
MKDVLCHVATFARIEDRLKRFGDHVSPLVIDDDSVFTRPWGEPADSPSRPLIVYATQDAYFSPSSRRFFQHLLDASELVWYQSSAAGLENPALRAAGRKALAFTSSHEQSPAIAEWVLWAAFDHLQGGPARRAAQAEESWDRQPFREMSETRWVIVGFGNIGRETARRLRALGAHVTGIRRSAGPDPDADLILPPTELYSALGEADAVLLCVPLGPETEGLADAGFFAAMKPGALFVNVGRGKLVDEAALLAGLSAGRPGHASLDVVATEPLPEGHPIWPHPQITLTPHIAALTEAAKHRTDTLFLDNLERHIAGTALRNLIEKSVFLED